jgi:hypothetical protein
MSKALLANWPCHAPFRKPRIKNAAKAVESQREIAILPFAFSTGATLHHAVSGGFVSAIPQI